MKRMFIALFEALVVVGLGVAPVSAEPGGQTREISGDFSGVRTSTLECDVSGAWTAWDTHTVSALKSKGLGNGTLVSDFRVNYGGSPFYSGSWSFTSDDGANFISGGFISINVGSPNIQVLNDVDPGTGTGRFGHVTDGVLSMYVPYAGSGGPSTCSTVELLPSTGTVVGLLLLRS